MQHYHLINSNAKPLLSKRNDSYFHVNIQGVNATGAFFPKHLSSNFKSFQPPTPPIPISDKPFHSYEARHISRSPYKMEFSLVKRLHSPDSYFQKNLDYMETRIFGKRIINNYPRWIRNEKFNYNQNINLNFTKDFEKLNDSLYIRDLSIMADDSSNSLFAKRGYSGNKSILSGNGSDICMIQKRNKNLKKSNFLNEFKIQNNYNGIKKEVFSKRITNLKKVKSSMEIAIPLKRISLSDEDDNKTVLKKFDNPNTKNYQNFIIKPMVNNLHKEKKFGSKRTVRPKQKQCENTILKVPQNIFYRKSDNKIMNQVNLSKYQSDIDLQRSDDQYRSGFREGMNFIRQNSKQIYSNLNRNPFNNRENTLFTKIVSPKVEKPKKKSQAACHIYKIMKNLSKIIYDRTLRRDKTKLYSDIEISLNDVDIKMNHLIGLKSLLSKFMKEEEITEKDMDLSNLEVLLFCLFLVKKRYLDLEALTWTPECLNQFRNQEMLKRSEQNYKVVLKRAFKTLISTFNAKNSILGGNENEFYKYYFGDVSKEFGISLDSFKPQQIFNEVKSRKQTKKFEKRKSKKEFASMLKKSDAFMDLLHRYLKDDLIINKKKEGIFIDCMKELDRKLPLMIFNWQKRLGNENNFKNEFIKFLVETLVNDKVKLPWSASEVRRGVSSVLRLFRKS